MSQILKRVYAGDTSVIKFTTLEIRLPAGTTLRYVVGYMDQVFAGNAYQGAPIDVAYPESSKGGAQSLKFAVGMLDDAYMPELQAALESGTPIYVTAAEWLDNDRGAPALATPPMVLRRGSISMRNELQFECTFHDILNESLLRRRYTIDEFPGVKYL